MNIKISNKQIIAIIKTKFFIAGVAFIIWVAFLDENNLVERYKLSKELKQYEKDKRYYKEKIEKDAARLKELQTNDENLEKFAREQYLMKRDNEDVFVVVK